MMWTFHYSRPNCFESRALQSFRRPCFFVVYPLHFNYAPLVLKFIYSLFCRKIWIYALFCRLESFACKSLLSGKLSTFLPLGVTCGLSFVHTPVPSSRMMKSRIQLREEMVVVVVCVCAWSHVYLSPGACVSHWLIYKVNGLEIDACLFRVVERWELGNVVPNRF